MITSVVNLSSTPCQTLSPNQLMSSWSYLGRLRNAHKCLLSSFAVAKHRNPFCSYEVSCQRVYDTSKCMSIITTSYATANLLNGRKLEMPLSTVCCASSASGSLVSTQDERNAEEFVEIGTIAETHGLYGELRVRSLTDFPEERFETIVEPKGLVKNLQLILNLLKLPGVRWVRRVTMGKPSIRRVELLEGREIIGKQSSWLVTLKGFDTPEKDWEQASELLGATLLVSADERPASLEDDEDYIPDLVGMAVIIQETKVEIGTVVDVHSSGASDLLRVQLKSSNKGKEVRIWIPFVKDIVPIVDNEAKRIEIRPPEGLLELNVPKEGLTRKDIRKQERKNKAILAAIRKRLTSLGQIHVLEGLSTGDESQQGELMEQLMSLDFGLFQRAVQHALGSQNSQQVFDEPQPPSAISRANWADFETWTDVKTHKNAKSENDTARWWYKGLQLVANGEVAVVVLAGGQSTRMGSDCPPVKGMLELDLPKPRSLFELQAERLRLVQELAIQIYPDSRPQIPWLVLTSDATDGPTREYFEEKEFFGLDESQVWFFKQDSLPCIDCNKGHAILLESPWRVAVAPSGNGGLFSALHTQGFLGRLSEQGVRYIQVYSVDNALVRVADPVFFGYTYERKADVGVKVVTKTSPEEAVGVLCLLKSLPEATSDNASSESKDVDETDDDDDVEEGISVNHNSETINSSRYRVMEYSEMPSALRTAKCEDALVYKAAHICINIFSVDYLTKLADPKYELVFHAALKRIPCLLTDESGNWETHIPDQPNGIKLEQFVFDAFQHCDPEKVALLEVDRTEEFAPIKNAIREGVPDTAETARDLVLALHNHISSTSQIGKPEAGGQSEDNQILSLLQAYVSGDI